jgi:hypothetical protein
MRVWVEILHKCDHVQILASLGRANTCMSASAFNYDHIFYLSALSHYFNMLIIDLGCLICSGAQLSGQFPRTRTPSSHTVWHGSRVMYVYLHTKRSRPHLAWSKRACCSDLLYSGPGWSSASCLGRRAVPSVMQCSHNRNRQTRNSNSTVFALKSCYALRALTVHDLSVGLNTSSSSGLLQVISRLINPFKRTAKLLALVFAIRWRRQPGSGQQVVRPAFDSWSSDSSRYYKQEHEV